MSTFIMKIIFKKHMYHKFTFFSIKHKDMKYSKSIVLILFGYAFVLRYGKNY